MAIDSINIDNIKPYNASKNESFEMLWFVICNEKYNVNGTFTPIDDSGGGDGVEFYLTLPNGDVWGWQCKFFNRFSESGRKDQIKKSLKKAYEKHGDKLKKWFLCSKKDCTPSEKMWFDNTLPKTIVNSNIELSHWGDSELLSNLTKHPEIENFFFGNDTLSLDWFDKHALHVFSKPSINSKYIKDTHTSGDTQDELYYYIGGKLFIDIIEKDIQDKYLNDAIDDYATILSEMREKEFPKNLQSLKEHIVSRLVEDEHIFEDGKNLLISIKNKFKTTNYGSPFMIISEEINNYCKRVEALIRWLDKIQKNDNLQDIKDVDISRISKSRQLTPIYIKYYIDIIQERIFDCWKYIAHTFELYKNLSAHEVNIGGDAGKGKSHLVLNVFDRYRAAKLPAVFLSAKDFSSNEQVEVQMVKILKLPNSYTLPIFLKYLNQYGKNIGQKSLLIIDGLNESPSYQTIWKNGLENLVAEINDYPNILLITTFRSSYKDVLFYTSSKANFLNTSGFDYKNFDEALTKYFKHYNIHISDYSYTKSFFKLEPLALKLFCEVHRNESVTLSQETLFDIFEQYIKNANDNIVLTLHCERYNKHLLSRELLSISQYMWDNNTNKIPLSVYPSKQNLKAICDEDLLVYREWDEEEYMKFTYDLMGGYIIAKYLIGKFNSVEDLLNAMEGELKNRLTKTISKSIHPLYDDITYCLFVLALQKFQFTNVDMLSDVYEPYLVKALVTASIKSVSNQGIFAPTFLGTKLTTNYQYIQEVKQCAFIEHHPLNFRYLGNQLAIMKIAQRDLLWTANESTYELSENLLIIEKFTNLCVEEGCTDNIHIRALYIMWMLTSNSHNLRFLATKALYYYGRKYPCQFVDLLRNSLEINDIYVPERMLAVAYGISLCLQNGDFENLTVCEFLTPLARLIYNKLYSKKAILITTHSLIREYSRKIIKLTNYISPTAFSPIEIKNIEHKSDINQSDIKNWDVVKDCGGPINMDFSNYTLGQLICDGSSYSNPEIKQRSRGYIYKRIYDFGWNKDLFDKVEKINIYKNAKKGSEERSIIRIDRFGKKYSWIAYYELTGILSDNNLLNKSYHNWTDVTPDIDPTFPKATPKSKIQFNHLLHPEMNFQTWFDDEREENYSDLCLGKIIEEGKNEFVCLYGHFNDNEKKCNKSRFTYIRPLICKTSETKELKEYLRINNFSGRREPEVLVNNDCFCGEMFFWSDATLSNWQELDLQRKQSEIDKENNIHRQLIKELIIKLEQSYNRDDCLKLLNEFNFEVDTRKKIKVLIPTMEYYMECDGAIGHESTISKEIVLSEGLRYIPQSFNLTDTQYQPASLNINFSEQDSSYNFVYLRKNILDNFLIKNNYSMIFLILGEKQHSSNFTYRKHFQQIISYKPNPRE